jgi:hypothetical protein
MITRAAVPALHHHQPVTAQTHRLARPCRGPAALPQANGAPRKAQVAECRKGGSVNVAGEGGLSGTLCRWPG